MCAITRVSSFRVNGSVVKTVRESALTTNRSTGSYDARAVAAELRRRILSGELPPGSRLPSLSKLTRARGLTPYVARRAMKLLCDTSLVVPVHGRGFFVAEDRFVYRIHSGTRFGSNMRAEGKSIETRLLGAKVIRASTEVARSMGLRSGAPILRADLLRIVEGRPAILGHHHYQASGPYSVIADHLASTGSVSAAFRQLGLSEFRRRETLIGTRLPSRFEARCLSISNRQPIIVATGINVDEQNQVVEVSVSLSRGDRVRLHA